MTKNNGQLPFEMEQRHVDLGKFLLPAHGLNKTREQAQRGANGFTRIAHEEPASAPETQALDHSDNKMLLLAHTLAQHVLLPPEDMGAISELPYKLRSLPAGSYLLREGDAPTQCAFLVSGFACRQKLNNDGARQILSLHIPGEALDMQNLFLDISDHGMQTLTKTDVAIVSRQALAELARTRPTIARAITTALLIEASIYREWLLNIGRRDARARIAHLLCEFGVRLSAHAATESYGHELPMTQEQLGDALGLTPVHVNRTLRALQREGLLTRTGRCVSFPDWGRLCEVADFSPRYLHLGQKRW